MKPSSRKPVYGIDHHLGDLGDHPRLRVLNDDKLERLHRATLEVLETVGVKITRPAVLAMMAAAGCTVDGQIVKIPPQLVEDAIAAAPKKITVFNRDGEEALHLGGSAVYTMTGYTDLDFFDVETGERRPYTLDDIRLAAHVADALTNVDAVGQPGVVRPTAENPLEVVNHLEVEAMLTHTTKPLHLLVASADILNDCFEMAEAVAVANGACRLAEKPFVMPMLNPISPLVYADDTIDKLLLTVDWGLPVICGPMPMAGGTSPVTLAGTIVQNTAESLAGLVISQVRRRGAPYVMITFAVTLDMSTGDFASGPETALLNLGILELGHYYGLPICGSWMGGGYRGEVDAETGCIQMLNGLGAMLAAGNAGVGVGLGPSAEACVLADEMVGMLKVMMQGVPVNDETLALDAIREVGPGGGVFLDHDHTLRHFREHWQPGIMKRMRYEDWTASGRPSIRDRAREKVQHILSTHRPKPIAAAAQQKIAAIIARARARCGKINTSIK